MFRIWHEMITRIKLIGLSPACGMVRIFKIYSCRTSHDDNPPLLTAAIMLYIIRSIKYIHVMTEKLVLSIISPTSAHGNNFSTIFLEFSVPRVHT